jgi:hypothetical protein
MTVKSPRAPQPTQVGNLGEVSSRAGIPVHKTNKGNIRVLPSIETCLAELKKFVKDRKREGWKVEPMEG